MGPVKNVAAKYWVSYYLVYVGAVSFALWLYPPWQEQGKEVIYLLAAIFGAAAGFALLVAIILEVIGRMVLLIPSAVKKLKDEGRKEGRKEGRLEERKRIKDALAQLREREGVAVQVPPEVIKILQGEPNDRP